MSYDFVAASSHHAEVTAGADVITGYPWSMMTWFKMKSAPSGTSMVPFAMRDSAVDSPFSLLAVNTSSQAFSQWRTNGGNVVQALQATPTVSLSTWYFLGLVCASRTSLKVYFGTNVTENTADQLDWTAANNTNRIVVGANWSSGGFANFANMLIEHAALWNGTALSAGQMATLAGGALPDVDVNPTIWYPMDTDQGTTLTDFMGTGYNLAVTGATFSSDHAPVVGGGGGGPLGMGRCIYHLP